MVCEKVRNSSGRARLPQMIVDTQIVEICCRDRPICIQVDQRIVTVINVALIRARACRPLNPSSERIVFVVYSQSVRESDFAVLLGPSENLI